MKKTLALLLFFAVACPFALAQKTSDNKDEQKLRITGGVSASLVASNFIHSNIDGGKSIMRQGYSLGGFMDMGINRHFSIQLDLILGYRMSDFSRNGKTGTFSSAGIDVPIYAMFHMNCTKSGKINLGVGPFTNFGFYGRYSINGEIRDVYEPHVNNSLSTMKDNYSGVALKAGYEFGFGLQLNCCYKLGLTNVLDENGGNVSMFPQTPSFEIAYRF